jgi:hypothetical protein
MANGDTNTAQQPKQKMDRTRFAQYLRKNNPSLPTTISDEQLVEAAIKKEPSWAPLIEDRKVDIPAGATIRARTWQDRYNEVKQGAKSVGRGVVDALPAIGGMAAVAAAPETGGGSLAAYLSALTAAGLGGAGGEATKQIIKRMIGDKDVPDELKDMLKADLKEGLSQAGYEAGGRALEYPAGKLIGAMPKVLKPADASVARTSEKYGLGMMPTEIVPGGIRDVQQSAVEHAHLTRGKMEAVKNHTFEAAENAVNTALQSLSQPNSRLSTGGSLVESLEDANKIYHAEGEKLYQRVAQLSPNLLVNISSVRAEASRMLRASSSGGSAAYFGRTGALTSTEKSVLQDIKNAPDYVPFQAATEYRSRLRGLGPASDDLMPGRGPGLAKHFVGRLTDAIERAGQGITGANAVQAWQDARKFWREGAEIFEGGLVQKLIDTDPSKVVAGIKTPEDIGAVKTALFNYGGHNPSSPEALKAAASWDKFRERYVRDVLLGTGPSTSSIGADPLKALSDNLKNMEPETLQAIFGDARGGRAYETLKEIGNAMDRVTKMKAPVQTTGYWSFLRYGGPEEGAWLLSKALLHPEASRYVLYAVRQLPRIIGADQMTKSARDANERAKSLMLRARQVVLGDERRGQFSPDAPQGPPQP